MLTGKTETYSIFNELFNLRGFSAALHNINYGLILNKNKKKIDHNSLNRLSNQAFLFIMFRQLSKEILRKSKHLSEKSKTL